MATSYETIYERAIFHFSDYQILKFTDEDREKILEKYRLSAEKDFVNVCNYNLSDKDDELRQYNADLDNESIEILALGIAYYWISSKTLREDLFRSNIGTKEYSYSSNANILKEVNSLRKDIGKEFHDSIVKYSYNHGDISSLKA